VFLRIVNIAFGLVAIDVPRVNNMNFNFGKVLETFLLLLKRKHLKNVLKQ